MCDLIVILARSLSDLDEFVKHTRPDFAVAHSLINLDEIHLTFAVTYSII